ncbi:MAG: flagellar basal-body rod protein FlgB [Spirochaetes bacterium GWC1_27_15]|nr:MAG: flagellar basal-body rod protein FlgB [Spirochaetes bacterium GWB1_27_13]OHD25352.1 MAG: flagellar basal-body rod protein FlgB [Spirochaetes bacterium GWC1_27_15]
MVLFQGNSSKMIDIMQRSMGASTMRAQVLNNNIANATTPNYKRQDITFQAELEKALNSEQQYPGTPFEMTDEKHIPAYRMKDYRDVQAKKITEYNTYQNNNGNSVDIDTEMLESAKNTMYYNALAQRTAKEFNKLKFLMRT